MATLTFDRVATSMGPMWLAETDAGIVAAARAGPIEEFLGSLRRRFGGWSIEADTLDGTWVDVALGGGPLPAVDLRGLSSFDARVYEAVRDVPVGSTVTYGEVAALIGSPGAARAVGGAMARCPLFPAVPCHRVVRAADGWSGWGGDPSLKRRLLQAERHGA
jgi:AraC family transcriptional regulator of adaptative response/methylated-DNA-[protein]-cysteine methyltransferase